MTYITTNHNTVAAKPPKYTELQVSKGNNNLDPK